MASRRAGGPPPVRLGLARIMYENPTNFQAAPRAPGSSFPVYNERGDHFGLPPCAWA